MIVADASGQLPALGLEAHPQGAAAQDRRGIRPYGRQSVERLKGLRHALNESLFCRRVGEWALNRPAVI